MSTNPLPVSPSAAPSAVDLLLLPEVLKLTRRSKSSLYYDVRSGRFPPPLRIGTGRGRIAWYRADLDGWLHNLPRVSPPTPAHPDPADQA